MQRTASKNSALPNLLLGWMESLADETRLRLLRVLERQELGVVELCDVLQLPQSTVSRHLKMLSDQGWVRSQRKATNNLYRLTLDELDPPQRRLWLIAREQTEQWATAEQDRLRLTRLLQSKRQDSRAFFAGAAGQWDKLREELYGRRFGQAAMLSLLPDDAIIADLGCGTGQFAETVAPYVGRVIGVDNSQPMLKAARRRLESIDNVDLRSGDLEALPIDSGSCDAVIMQLVLTYLREPSTAIAEAARVLKPSGRLIIVDLLQHDRDDFRREMNQYCMGFAADKLNEMLERAGLRTARMLPLPPEPEAKGPALLLATATKATATKQFLPKTESTD